MDTPNAMLRESHEILLSADSEVVDRCTRWFNLAGDVVKDYVPTTAIVDLS